LQLKIRNFGPLKYVNIKIKPMTIIIGKNNLGKSYTAQLFYVLLNSVKGFSKNPYYLDRLAMREIYFFRESEIRKIAINAKKEKWDNLQITKNIAGTVIKLNCANLQRQMPLELERAFGVDISKLININSKTATIECDFFKGGSLHIE
jgi:predicted ATPase